MFRELWSNDDARKYKAGKQLLDGRHLWLESLVEDFLPAAPSAQPPSPQPIAAPPVPEPAVSEEGASPVAARRSEPSAVAAG